jgi:hypothetical protein
MEWARNHKGHPMTNENYTKYKPDSLWEDEHLNFICANHSYLKQELTEKEKQKFFFLFRIARAYAEAKRLRNLKPEIPPDFAISAKSLIATQELNYFGAEKNSEEEYKLIEEAKKLFPNFFV